MIGQRVAHMSEILASGLAPGNPAESAIVATLSPGNYTAVVSGYGGGQGIGLVEAYEFDGNTDQAGQYFHARPRRGRG